MVREEGTEEAHGVDDEAGTAWKPKAWALWRPWPAVDRLKTVWTHTKRRGTSPLSPARCLVPSSIEKLKWFDPLAAQGHVFLHVVKELHLLLERVDAQNHRGKQAHSLLVARYMARVAMLCPCLNSATSCKDRHLGIVHHDAEALIVIVLKRALLLQFVFWFLLLDETNIRNAPGGVCPDLIEDVVCASHVKLKSRFCPSHPSGILCHY